MLLELFPVIVALVIVGLVLWVVSELPLDATIKRIIKVVVIVIVLLWLLGLLLPYLGGIHYVPRRGP